MFRANRFDWLNLGVEDNEENTIAWKKFKNVGISLDPYKRKKIILKIPVKKKKDLRNNSYLDLFYDYSYSYSY